MAHCRGRRGVLLRVLSRIADEGVIARNRGHGWTFVPTIDSDLALAGAYDFAGRWNRPASGLPVSAPMPRRLEQLRHACSM